MEFRLLLVQAIALLFWESKLENEGLNSKEIVLNLIKEMPAIENMAGTDEDRDNLLGLRNIALWLANSTEVISQDNLLSKIKLSIKKDPELKEDATDYLSGELSKEAILERVQGLQNDLKSYNRKKHFLEDIKKLAARTIYNYTGSLDIPKISKETIALLEDYATYNEGDEQDPAINENASLDNLDEMMKIFAKVQDDVNPESVMRTGWQGFNRMCGEVGGLRRGNMYVVGAMPYNGKSLVSMQLATHVGRFNKPFMYDMTKKPMIVHFSTENDMQTNFKFLFRMLWEEEFQRECNLLEFEPEYMANYLKEKLEANGYNYRFYYLNSGEANYRKVIEILMQHEAEGYEIHLAVVDYLAMLDYTDLPGGNEAAQIQYLFNRLRSFCNPRGIAVVVPHQVSVEAVIYKRQGSDDFVKQIAGKRFWAKCKSIDMEVDMEIVLNIETDSQKNKWMAFGRGKDRSSASTPLDDQFFFLPFSKYGALVPDINGKDSSKRQIRETVGIETATDWVQQDPEY